MDKDRLETFSDGVFAIAITLLVITIAMPTNYADLDHELISRWPAFTAYAVSFVVIGIMWLNHHSLFLRFSRVNRPLFYLNLAVLLTVVALPFTTGVFGEALRRGQGARVAAVAYSALMTLNGLSFAALWLYASTGRHLLTDEFPEHERRPATLAFAIGPILYSVTVAIAFVNAIACLAAHALLALYYALDPLARRPVQGDRMESGSTED